MIIPRPLKPGSVVAIISPASVVKEEYVRGAADFLRNRGYEAVIMPHALGPADGCFAGGFQERLDDLLTAWQDPRVDAVLCARGGYGTAHLLPYLPPEIMRANAKWLVGFSDISALHAALLAMGVASIHGPMAKHLCEDPDNESTRALFHLLEGGRMEYRLDRGNAYNRPGHAHGRLMGGNLAVLNGLSATPFDIFGHAVNEDVILFIEDVSEAIYAVERMLWRLYMAGTLNRIKGLVIGHFTEYRPSLKYEKMYDMIHSLLLRAGIDSIPVVFGFPTGHLSDNLPLVQGAEVELDVESDNLKLVQLIGDLGTGE